MSWRQQHSNASQRIMIHKNENEYNMQRRMLHRDRQQSLGTFLISLYRSFSHTVAKPFKVFHIECLSAEERKSRQDMRKLHENQKSAQRQNSSKRLKDFIMLKMGRNSAGCVWGRRRALVLSQHRGECVEWPLNPVASLTANRAKSRDVQRGERQRKAEQKKKEKRDNV